MTWRVLGDWGTSNLRLYRIENGRVTSERDGPGIGSLPGSAVDALRAALGDWCLADRPRCIDMCGMVGSRNGLLEVPYLECPARADDWAAAAVRHALDDIPMRLAPGLACANADTGPDVMRGEETQIFGALAIDPSLRERSVRIVLPGTHSKWVRVEQGKIVSFRTCLSGELFALLRDHSILLKVATPDTPADTPADGPAGFEAGLDRAACGNGLTGSLFEARAQQLRAGKSASWALGFLSGLVIGNEIVDLHEVDDANDEQADPVVIVGTPDLRERYKHALARFGVPSLELDGATCVLRGLELIDAHG